MVCGIQQFLEDKLSRRIIGYIIDLIDDRIPRLVLGYIFGGNALNIDN